MTNQHFAILDYHVAQLTTALCVTCYSDTPCHLDLYLTNEQPHRTTVTRILRGLPVPWATHYCFVAFETYEQIQPGDTLVHTFQFYPPQTDLKSWFTWAGTIAGLPSPSRGPIIFFPFTGQDILYNLSWDWPEPPTPLPPFWTAFTFGTGWSRWHRRTTGTWLCDINPELEAGGYARGTGLRQLQDATKLRNQPIRIRAYMKGYPYANNDLTVGVNGTGGWLLHSDPPDPFWWEARYVQGVVPFDATTIAISLRCYSPGYGPVFTRFDRIELIPG